MDTHVISELQGRAGLITLNRPRALNALSLAMIRSITASLLDWRADPAVLVVGLRGMRRAAVPKANGTAAQGARGSPVSKAAVPDGADQPFGAFCAGGDIRFFHQAALAGNPELEDFFTEEYRLNHLIHTYPKPVVAFMDGIVMGGGMGLAQGASARIVTARTRMAMPETQIGLFPDVGGGYFLSRCPGHLGEYLALTGQVISGAQAVAAGLADQVVEPERLGNLWDALADYGLADGDTVFGDQQAAEPAPGNGEPVPGGAPDVLDRARIDRYFDLPDMTAIVQALEADAGADEWAHTAAGALRQRSPLMLQVTLQQIRRARQLGLAEDLRMERDLVRHCFHPAHLGRLGAATDVVEGIRALAVDKDHTPRWNPASIEGVTAEMVTPFFTSPWPAHAHPLRELR